MDSGTKSGVTTDQARKAKVLERKVQEIKPAHAHEILNKAAVFRPDRVRPQTEIMAGKKSEWSIPKCHSCESRNPEQQND